MKPNSAQLRWLLLPCLSATVLAADPPWIARGKGGMVASDSREASQVGADVLKAGGNAFDAAVATSLALAVARPESTGLGGGGFLIAYVANEKRFVALDFREVAPASATPERFAKLVRERGDGPSPSIYGGNAVGVPGQVAGLAEINHRWGTRPLAELTRGAITLAETGFTVDEHYRDSCQDALRDYDKWPPLKQRFPAVYKTLLGNGAPAALGAKLRRPDLADTLRVIGERGSAAFYEKPIGEALVRAVNDAGGALTTDDLRKYRVRERAPLRAKIKDLEIISMPPPSSGGACLIELLNVLLAATSRPELQALEHRDHVLVEAFKHAFADRARWFGDPDFCDVPVQRLIGAHYAAQLAERIRPRQTLDSNEYGTTTAPDDGGTSHFCVVDRLGNIVALTETINGTFGSLVLVEPYGVLLNNQMDDFTTSPGQANLFGLVQGQSNVVAPGKRPLSSMAPTIVLKGGQPALTLGGSGGPRIITAVVQVILRVLERGMPLEQALPDVRLHHQWQPDEVYFDGPPPAELLDALRHAGHTLSEQRKTAAVQAIQFLPDGTLIGACDPRKGGRPAGRP